MRVLIRDRNTGLYFKDNNYWVARGEDAVDFQHSLSALNFCENQKLTNVEIVLRFASRTYDIKLPIHARVTSRD